LNAGPGSLLGRVPGKARPQSEAMDEWRELDQQFKPDTPHLLRRMFLPEPTEMYRWRVALACGCVYEEWTRGADDFPDAHREDDSLRESHEYRLRELERRCRRQHPEPERSESPYRRIVEWVEDSRKVREFDADPVEPPEAWKDTPEVWADIRHKTPGKSAHWVVKLNCGHYSGVASSVKFRPQDGPKRVSAKRLAEMKAEHADYRNEYPLADDNAREAHYLRMLDERWPTPRTETTCYWCGGGTSTITAYQRIGWLEGEPKPVTPRKPKRQVLEERLARLEAEKKQLRHQLSELHEGD
jgi:hypothetical protein